MELHKAKVFGSAATPDRYIDDLRDEDDREASVTSASFDPNVAVVLIEVPAS